MWETNLLSPHRVPHRLKRKHKGRIVTEGPNLVWEGDGAQMFTTNNGWGWIFAHLLTLEHGVFGIPRN